MKRIFFSSVFLLGLLTYQGQQIALNSQYLFNDFAINPAIAGTKSYAPLSLSFRKQWMGIDEAPTTQNLMYHTYMGDNMGFGGHIFNDASGPTSRFGISATYAYNVKTSKKTKLSFGFSGSLTQFSIDRTRLITEVPGDVAVINSTNQLIPDCNFGIHWNGENHFFGFSSFNLFENKTNLIASSQVVNTLNRIFYLNGGYNFKIGALLEIQPSAVLRIMDENLVQIDGNLNFTFKNAYSIGFSYRHRFGFCFMGGINLGSTTIGYAYDLGINNFMRYGDTHEVFVSFKLRKNNQSKAPWKNRNRVYSSSSSEN